MISEETPLQVDGTVTFKLPIEFQHYTKCHHVTTSLQLGSETYRYASTKPWPSVPVVFANEELDTMVAEACVVDDMEETDDVCWACADQKKKKTKKRPMSVPLLPSTLEKGKELLEDISMYTHRTRRSLADRISRALEPAGERPPLRPASLRSSSSSFKSKFRDRPRLSDSIATVLSSPYRGFTANINIDLSKTP